jgi:hypothetical protein
VVLTTSAFISRPHAGHGGPSQTRPSSSSTHKCLQSGGMCVGILHRPRRTATLDSRCRIRTETSSNCRRDPGPLAGSGLDANCPMLAHPAVLLCPCADHRACARVKPELLELSPGYSIAGPLRDRRGDVIRVESQSRRLRLRRCRPLRRLQPQRLCCDRDSRPTRLPVPPSSKLAGRESIKVT